MLYLILAVLGVVLKAADCITTYIGIEKYSAKELNPIASWTFKKFGLKPTLVVYFVIVVVCLGILFSTQALYSLIILDILMAVVVVNNLYRLIRRHQGAKERQ